jgi:poly(hydroxyalkanoate) granule-associated protein
MAKKPTPSASAPTDQAQQIWLAGLGAFSQAQKKGSEALHKMLQDGLHLQRQAQQTAEQKIADATGKMSAMAQQLAQGKVPMPGASKAPAWDSLEGLFEQRVARALERMGWADPARMDKLEQRIAELEHRLAVKNPAHPTAKAKTAAKRKPRNG